MKTLRGGVYGTEDARRKFTEFEVLKLELREVPLMFYQEVMVMVNRRTAEWRIQWKQSPMMVS